MNSMNTPWDDVTLADGTKIFRQRGDFEKERETISLVEKVWSCRIHAFPNLCPVDGYAERSHRMIGLTEIKSRTHAFGAFDTTLMPVKKWWALSFGEMAFGCPAIYVVKFTDAVYWAPLRKFFPLQTRLISPRDPALNGETELSIEIPIEVFTRLTSTSPDI